MLESVIEQVQLRTEILLGVQTSGIAIFADHDRHSQLACDQQRLVAELPSRARRIDQRDAFSLAAVSARKHVEQYAALLEQLAQQIEGRASCLHPRSRYCRC